MSDNENDRKLPSWIVEYVPRELVESTLFRFNVTLQIIDDYFCSSCNLAFVEAGECNRCSTKLKPRQKSVKVDLLPDLDLDYEQLVEQLQDVPAQYAFWSAVYSEAKLQTAIDERRLKATKGRITELVQTRARDENIKLTGEQVKAVVEADEQIIRDDMRLQRAHMVSGKLFHMLEALKIKGEIGRSLSGFKKKEYEGS